MTNRGANTIPPRQADISKRTLAALVAPLLILAVTLSGHRMISAPTPTVVLLSVAAILLSALLFPQRRPARLPLLLTAFGGLSLLWSWSPGDTLIWLQWMLIAITLTLWVNPISARVTIILLGAYQGASIIFFTLLSMHVYSPVWFNQNLSGITSVASLLLLSNLFTGKADWRNFAYVILAAFSWTGMLSSGSRGIYLIALLLIPLTLFWDNWQRPTRFINHQRSPITLIFLTASLAAAVTVDSLAPVHPLRDALMKRGSYQAQAASLEGGGSFSWRLRMKAQSAQFALLHPFGTGAGTYPSVASAVQNRPFALSASPHDTYATHAVTLGWPGFILFALLVLTGLRKAFQADDRALFLAQLALAWSLFIDIGDYVPGFLLFCLAIFGIPHGSPRNVPRTQTLKFTLAALSLLLAGYWNWPSNLQSRAARHLYPYWETKVTKWPQEDMLHIALTAEAVNTRSLWPLRLQQAAYANRSNDMVDKINVRIVREFPYVSPADYLSAVEYLIDTKEYAKAQAIATTGLKIYPETYDNDHASDVNLPQWRSAMKNLLKKAEAR